MLMSNQAEQPVEFDAGLADLLACPACHKNLHLDGERLVCGGCGRRFPVIDGIPVLIAERADLGD